MTRTPTLTIRRLLAAAVASGLLLGSTPLVDQAPAAPVKVKTVKAKAAAKKQAFSGSARKV